MAANDNVCPPSSQVESGHLQIVLIGKSRTGKSATGNTLLGETIFKSRGSPNPVTTECKCVQKERFGKTLVVLDTPELLDTNVSPSELVKQVVSCSRLDCPGVHAFLLVFRIGHRYNDKDQDAIESMKHLFCEQFVNHTIVVFTGKDTLEADEETLDEYMAHLPKGLRNTISSCKGGYVAISNIGSRDEREKAAKTIIRMIEANVERNGGVSRYYKTALFDALPQSIGERVGQILEGNEKIQDKIKKINKEMKFITGKDELLQRQREKLKKIVDFLQMIVYRDNHDKTTWGRMRSWLIPIAGLVLGIVLLLPWKFLQTERQHVK